MKHTKIKNTKLNLMLKQPKFSVLHINLIYKCRRVHCVSNRIRKLSIVFSMVFGVCCVSSWFNSFVPMLNPFYRLFLWNILCSLEQHLVVVKISFYVVWCNCFTVSYIRFIYRFSIYSFFWCMYCVSTHRCSAFLSFSQFLWIVSFFFQCINDSRMVGSFVWSQFSRITKAADLYIGRALDSVNSFVFGMEYVSMCLWRWALSQWIDLMDTYRHLNRSKLNWFYGWKSIVDAGFSAAKLKIYICIDVWIDRLRCVSSSSSSSLVVSPESIIANHNERCGWINAAVAATLSSYSKCDFYDLCFRFEAHANLLSKNHNSTTVFLSYEKLSHFMQVRKLSAKRTWERECVWMIRKIRICKTYFVVFGLLPCWCSRFLRSISFSPFLRSHPHFNFCVSIDSILLPFLHPKNLHSYTFFRFAFVKIIAKLCGK